MASTESTTVPHHPAILAIPRAPVIAPDGFAIDLVGDRTRMEFWERLVPERGWLTSAHSEAARGTASLTPPLPPIGPSYFGST